LGIDYDEILTNLGNFYVNNSLEFTIDIMDYEIYKINVGDFIVSFGRGLLGI